MREKKLIAIAGGIGSGKSVVSSILRVVGFCVYDCDSEAKRLMNESQEIKDDLILNFGIESILSNDTLTLSFGMLAGVILALVVAFFAEAYLGLSYYFVVEDEMSLGESLSASVYCMRGNITKYIGIKLVYIIPTIIALVGVNVFSIAFRTMFQQLVAIVPGVPIVVFNLMLVVINAIVSAFLSTILYKVKESISFALLYRDLKNAYYE